MPGQSEVFGSADELVIASGSGSLVDERTNLLTGVKLPSFTTVVRLGIIRGRKRNGERKCSS